MVYDNYISIYLCLIFVIGYVFVGIESFTPRPRLGHHSVIVGSKHYFFGGLIPGNGTSEEVFYLDLSQPPNEANLPFVDLTSTASIPFKSLFGTVALYNINNDPNIYLFGGIMRDIITNNDSFTSFVHKFNVNSLTWSVPSVSGTVPQRRFQMQAISDNAVKFYIFGGGADYRIGSQTFSSINDTAIFNAAESSWVINPLTINAPALKL